MPQKTQPKRPVRPPQHQRRQPGRETRMRPRPRAETGFRDAGRLRGKVALIAGGGTGIGRTAEATGA